MEDKDTNPVLSKGSTIWEFKELKIVKWMNSFILYDTDPHGHLSMAQEADTDDENMRRIELLKAEAKGYRKAKREFR